jgi:hypothetical protein
LAPWLITERDDRAEQFVTDGEQIAEYALFFEGLASCSARAQNVGL